MAKKEEQEQEREEIRNSIIKDLKNRDKNTTNLFTILGLETKEVMHSKFLAYLLSPTGNYISGGNDSNIIKVKHNFGTNFLEKFIEKCDLKIEKKDLDKANVYIEYPIKGKRRIDILIKIYNYWIGIENKINASDQKNQLKDYHDFLKKTNKNFCLIYLTLEGRAASEHSTGTNGIEYKKIGYQHINELLEPIKKNKIIKEYKSILEILIYDYTILEKLKQDGVWNWDDIDKLHEYYNEKINDLLKNYIYPDIISSMLQNKDNSYYQGNNTIYIWIKSTQDAEYDLFFDFNEEENKVIYYPIKIISQNKKWYWYDKNDKKWKTWGNRNTRKGESITVKDFDIESEDVKKLTKFIKENL